MAQLEFTFVLGVLSSSRKVYVLVIDRLPFVRIHVASHGTLEVPWYLGLFLRATLYGVASPISSSNFGSTSSVLLFWVGSIIDDLLFQYYVT